MSFLWLARIVAARWPILLSASLEILPPGGVHRLIGRFLIGLAFEKPFAAAIASWCQSRRTPCAASRSSGPAKNCWVSSLKHSVAFSCHLSLEPFTIDPMDLSFVFAIAIVVDAALLKLIPERRRVARFLCTSIFFGVHTVLIIALVGSPLHPVFRQQNPLRGFWLQILTCCWWALAARELISFLAMSRALRAIAVNNELLFDILTACIYVSSALAMMGFVFGLPLQGLLATSGIVAIVLGLALQSTLSDVFSGISLSIENSYQLGDEILLEGGVEGEVVAMNWRSTRLKNSANDMVIVPNSAIAKLRIQNHSAGSKRYNGGLTMS